MISAQYRHGKLLKHLKMRKSSKPNVIVTLLFERKTVFIKFLFTSRHAVLPPNILRVPMQDDN